MFPLILPHCISCNSHVYFSKAFFHYSYIQYPLCMTFIALTLFNCGVVNEPRIKAPQIHMESSEYYPVRIIIMYNTLLPTYYSEV